MSDQADQTYQNMGDRTVSLTWKIQTTETFKTEMTVQDIAQAIRQTPEAVADAIDAGSFGWSAFGQSYPGDDWIVDSEGESTSDDYSVDERDIESITFA